MSNDRRPLFGTEVGSRLDAFGSVEWSLMISIALVWGSSFLLIELSLETFHPSVISWSRIVLGFATLTLFPSARRTIDREDWSRIAVLSMTWVAIPFSLFPFAQQHIDSALTGMLIGLVPIFAAVFAAIFLRSMPRRIQAAGIGIGFVGVVGIGLPALGDSSSSVFGVGLVAVATVLLGLSINLSVPLQHRYGGPAVMVRTLGIASVATLPFALAGLSRSTWDVSSAAAVSVLGVLGTGVAFVLMAQFVGRVGPTRSGVAIYLNTIVSIVLGVVFLAETVVAAQLVGTILLLTGAWLTSRKERELS